MVWLYILDECDHAGVWDVEFDVLKIRTGITCNEEEIIKIFDGKIISFDDGEKWFIPDFIYFQSVYRYSFGGPMISHALKILVLGTH